MATERFHDEASPEIGRTFGYFWAGSRGRKIFCAALLFAAVLLGVLVGDDYGMSVDEPDNAYVGRIATRALVSSRAHAEYVRRGVEIAHHGPSYFMLWEAAARQMLRIAPKWHITDGRHFVNYLTFLGGLALFYRFARRFLEPQYALLTTAFMGTQPLFVGHAFINQKDTPFWVFLLASVVVGLWAVDRLDDSQRASTPANGRQSLIDRFWQEWKGREGVAKWIGLLLLLVGVLVSLDLLVFQRGLQTAEWIIRWAHSGRAWTPISQLYRAFAEDADKVSAAVYLEKLQWPYWLLRAPLLVLALLLSLVGLRLSAPQISTRLRRLYGVHILRFLTAGLVLGFTVSIRPIGLFAGGLVGLYWLLSRRLRPSGLLLPYGLATGLTTYLTWPYLWPAPYQRFIQTILFTGNLQKDTMYWGRIISSDSLPWHYFPTYLATELTEPSVPLIALGLGMTGRHIVSSESNRPSLLTALAWIVVPPAGFVAVGGGVYGNIRHLLFVVIPLLLLAGLAIQRVSDWLRKKVLISTLVLALLAPGVLGITRLHPYQYTYFNAFVGGVDRAADLHILDRWCTSYREAMSYVNVHAQTGAVVGSVRELDVARPFARGDLSVPNWSQSLLQDADYILTCGFQLGMLRGDPRWNKVHQVGRAGAVFAEVYAKTPSGRE